MSTVRLENVTLGLPRISVVAVLGDTTDWSAADWETLRESGVSACVGRGSGRVPSLNPDDIILDKEKQLALYPEWSRTLGKPWGPVLEGGEVALGLAAVCAGAPLVAVRCPRPEAAAPLVNELKALSGVLGRELTRVPKPAEAPRAAPARTDKLFPNTARVAFQGEHGAFSEMAVYNLFPSDAPTFPKPVFREVYNAVLAGEVDFGMIPIENALAGSITENYDLLLEFPDVHIVGETQVRVEHNLIGLPGTSLDTIRRVFSQPPALAQSKQFLDAHPQWEAVPFYDTAGSVKHISQLGDPSLAAIASSEAARVYGMEILVPGVETNHRNFTRFFLIARPEEAVRGVPNKASIVFGTADEPGALNRCLAVFSTHGVNMTKLESRPIHGRPWDYMFYVDLRLPESSAFQAAFDELGRVAKDLRLLGVYPA